MNERKGMERISERVRIEEGATGLRVRIAAYRESAKQRILTLWVVLWSLCGLFVAAQLFTAIPGQQKLILIVFLAFWGYFEYMALYALIWRYSGEEELRIGEGELLIESRILSKKKAARYALSKVKALRVIEHEEEAFRTQLESAYYVLGRPMLGFEYDGTPVRFGEKLSETEAKELATRLNRTLS